MSSNTSTTINKTRRTSTHYVKDCQAAQSEHKSNDVEVDEDDNEFMTAGFTEHQYNVPRNQALQAAYNASIQKVNCQLVDDDEYDIIQGSYDAEPATEEYMTAGFIEHQYNVPRRQALLAAYQASPSKDTAEYVHVEGPDDDDDTFDEPFMSTGFTEHQFAGTSVPRDQVMLAAYHASREAYTVEHRSIKTRGNPFGSILRL